MANNFFITGSLFDCVRLFFVDNSVMSTRLCGETEAFIDRLEKIIGIYLRYREDWGLDKEIAFVDI